MQNKIRGTVVFVRNGNVEQALRKFKKKIQANNTLIEVKEREFFEKPSQERKKKREAAVKRQQRLHSETIAKGPVSS